MREQSKCEQASGFGVVRADAMRVAGQLDRVGAELRRFGSGRCVIAHGEHQRDHRESIRHPLGDLAAVGHREPDRRLVQVTLGPGQPRGHRRLRDEQHRRDIARRDAAGEAQRQAQPRLFAELGVTHGEDELESLIARERELPRIRLVRRRGVGHEQRMSARRRALTADGVDGDAPRRGGDPCGGIARPLPRVLLSDRACERLLHGILRQLQVTGVRRDRTEDAPGVGPERILDADVHLASRGQASTGRAARMSRTGCRSSQPPVGTIAASSRACSGESAVNT